MWFSVAAGHGHVNFFAVFVGRRFHVFASDKVNVTSMWHVIFEERDGEVQSRVARSRDLAIQMACELLHTSHQVRRAIGPQGAVMEKDELEAHYDNGHFPGLRQPY